MRTTALLAGLLLVATTASAGLVSDRLLVYQYDGGAPGDAADDCLDADRPIYVGKTIHGMVLPPDDQDDFYALIVNTTDPVKLTLGTVATENVAITPLAETPLVIFRLYAKDCTYKISHGNIRTNGESVIEFEPTAPGTYALHVLTVNATLAPHCRMGPDLFPPPPTHQEPGPAPPPGGVEDDLQRKVCANWPVIPKPDAPVGATHVPLQAPAPSCHPGCRMVAERGYFITATA